MPLVCGMWDTESGKVIGEATLEKGGGMTGLNQKPGRFSKSSLIQTWPNTVGKPAVSTRIERRNCYVEPEKNVLGPKIKMKTMLSPATWTRCQQLAERQPPQGLTNTVTPGHAPTPVSFSAMRMAQLSWIPIWPWSIKGSHTGEQSHPCLLRVEDLSDLSSPTPKAKNKITQGLFKIILL